MENININNPTEIRAVGMKALTEALGHVGAIRFIQQYDLGYGNYTEEKQNEPNISLNEIDSILKK